MNRFWGHTLSAAVLTVAAGTAIPACAHNDASIFVHGVLLPPTPNGNACIYTADPTAALINHGVVDGALTDNYSPEFLVGSTLIPKGNLATPDSETARLVGQRRGKATVLRVRAGAMHRDGHPFWLSANGVWLTEAVPPNYLDTEA